MLFRPSGSIGHMHITSVQDPTLHHKGDLNIGDSWENPSTGSVKIWSGEEWAELQPKQHEEETPVIHEEMTDE